MAPGCPRQAFRGSPDLGAALPLRVVLIAWRPPGTETCGPGMCHAVAGALGDAAPFACHHPRAPVCLGADERRVDEVLREQPRLELARADDVGDHQVIAAVITECRDAGRRVVRVAQDELVCLE